MCDQPSLIIETCCVAVIAVNFRQNEKFYGSAFSTKIRFLQ